MLICMHRTFSSLMFVHLSFRPNGLVQGYANLEGSPPSVHGMQPGYPRAISKPLLHGTHSNQQNSPSRLGQQTSQFQQPFQQQYRPSSMLNSDQHLIPNAFGQQYIHQPSSLGHNQISNGGKSSVYSLSSAQKETRADCTWVPGTGSGVSAVSHSYSSHPQDHGLENTSLWLPGMPHAQPQNYLANEISWGTISRITDILVNLIIWACP